jgi:ubiquinone/menaquinone biosynthesis C-methylase UbiE
MTTQSDHDEYLKQQLQWSSKESLTPRFIEGQRRYLELMLQDFPRDLTVLDIGCGEGVGVEYLINTMEFTNVTGMDISEEKLNVARYKNLNAVKCDFHRLPFPDKSFDVAYSSHSLEHALSPSKVVSEIKRVLRVPGVLLVVLPYPDRGDWNNVAHCGKFELGTNILDEGKSVEAFFKRAGFSKIELNFDNFREPEIWVTVYSS